jgi:hypothetical protein
MADSKISGFPGFMRVFYTGADSERRTEQLKVEQKSSASFFQGL